MIHRRIPPFDLCFRLSGEEITTEKRDLTPGDNSDPKPRAVTAARGVRLLHRTRRDTGGNVENSRINLKSGDDPIESRMAPVRVP